MIKSYLVIWQLGDNEQSRTDTPVDISLEETQHVSSIDSDIKTWGYCPADEKYSKIMKAVADKEGLDDENIISVIGIFQL